MKRLEREWMYKRLDERKRVRREFVTGVCEFLEFTKTQRDFQSNGQIRCPCRDCQNLRFKDIRSVKEDLYTKGFCDHYFEWVSHGEKMSNVEPSVVGNATTNYENMVRDAFPHSFGHEYVDDVELVQEDPNPKSKEFFDMLKNAQEPLYDGCNRTIMEMASRLMDLKCDHNLAHRCVDGIAAFLDDFIPAENSMTRTFYETKKILKGLELPVEKIHACPNGWMLFWKDDVNLEKCKVCDRDRYKITSCSHREARKILTYFPLTPRLQRLYATSQVAEQMRWHKDNPRVSGTMAHPSDGEAWKHFDSVYPEFASESRNVRLGLCTDGFAPHGKFGGSYSCWPVILTPYNLPPWLCMKKQFMFLSMIIPGPKAPKANLDVYLQPLIDELNKLWDTGEITYDVSMKKNFTLKAALMWTINDFPAYGMLSGWSTSGLHGCPCCMEKSRAFSLQYGKKVSWFDCHRQFLPEDHPYRRNKNAFYINRVESRQKPKRKNGEQLWDEVSNLPKATDPNFITIMKSLKKNGLNGWTNQSIFWELPYWKDLLIRHNLDVMHIEKNFFEQLIHTIMNVKDYTSDNVNARKDLKLYCNRPGLALNKDAKIGDAKAKAPYELDKAQKKVLLQWVEKLKFPDGYASDFARCVDLNKLKLFNLKSHDCHVFLERLLPVASSSRGAGGRNSVGSNQSAGGITARGGGVTARGGGVTGRGGGVTARGGGVTGRGGGVTARGGGVTGRGGGVTGRGGGVAGGGGVMGRGGGEPGGGGVTGRGGGVTTRGGGVTERGGGITGRASGSSLGSNSAQGSMPITDEEIEDDDETQQASAGENDDEHQEADGGEMVLTGQIRHLDPDSLWFSHHKVVRDVSRAIKKHYPSAFMNWRQTPQHQRDQWFNLFKKKYTWSSNIEPVVRKTFNRRAAKRLKGLVSYVGRTGLKPDWMSEDAFIELGEKRSDPNFKIRSKKALENKRKGAENGKIVPGHRNGSISTVELVERMTQERNGVRPTPKDIFDRSHTITTATGETLYVSEKAQLVADNYERMLVEYNEEGVVKPAADVFYEAVGGHVKGQVYGLGQGADLYYDKSLSSGRTTASSHDPAGRIVELEHRIESLETMLAERTDFELQMRRQMDEFLFSARNNCGSSPSQRDNNPDDPAAGGNGTSCAV